jgi:CubicO group peptidase (beta-lactamase class C family)
MTIPPRPVATTAALAVGLTLLGACSHTPPGRAALVATGYVSHQLCSAVFVSGQDAERNYLEAIAPMGGPFGFLLSHQVDRERGEVRATLAGLAESRAVHRPPLGCVNATGTALTGSPASAAPPPPTEEIPSPPSDPALALALERAFTENADGPRRNTQAVVVMQRGRIVAERYAPGIGVDTPLPGWSATKSVTNALLGVLVRQGRLDMNAPAPIAAWADPQDPRRAITSDQLLRMTSGLDAGQSLVNVSPFDPAARLLFIEHDMAAFAASRPLAYPPGTHWNYADPNTLLLSRIVRDLAGGDAASTRAFIYRELLDRIGMRHATFEFDAAGTPIGGSHLWASARDWGRLGQLFLDDGIVNGGRLLPPGWVEYSSRPTPGAEYVGYGAGFWTNRGSGYGASYRIGQGMPADAYMARGSHGQYVVIVPSQQLVVVRLGPAWTPRDDMDAVARLTSEAIAALPGKPGIAMANDAADRASAERCAPDRPARGSAPAAGPCAASGS